MFVEKLAASVIAVLVLFSPEALALSPDENQGPAPIAVPDIRANIIKMLQQNAAEEEDLFAKAEKQQEKAQQPPAPVEQTDEPAMPATKPDIQPPQPPQRKERPVELPVKEFVIEDLDDLKKLAEELQKAKKRQSGQ